MVGLRGDHNARTAEHVFRAVHALVGGEARVVAEDVLGRHALRDRVAFHRRTLVVVLGAVVARHDDLGRGPRLVERDAAIEAVLQNRRRRAIGEHRRAEHDDRIGLITRGLVDAHDIVFRREDHQRIRRADDDRHGGNAGAQYFQQRLNHAAITSMPFKPREDKEGSAAETADPRFPIRSAALASGQRSLPTRGL